MSLRRRQFTRDFKVTVVGELERGKSPGELARLYEIQPSLIFRWHRELQANPTQAFTRAPRDRGAEGRVAELERMIGQLTMENALLKKALWRLEEGRRLRSATGSDGCTNSSRNK